jgi:hypothetical protein
MIWRSTAQLLAAVLVLPGTVVGQDHPHIEEDMGWRRAPLTNAALDARIGSAALQYRSYAPIPRVAFFDIAYPSDSAEAHALEGYALLVVTALTQDSAELPLARLYVRSSVERTLPLLRGASSRLAARDSAIAATFGFFRFDGIYMLPLAYRASPGELLADFVQGRQGFRLGRFDAPLPDALQRLGQLTPPVRLPPDSVTWKVVRREFPDLARALEKP